MKNPQNITITLLAITAVILAAILVGTYSTEPAAADVSVKGGEYIMSVVQYSDSRDLICVIDIATRKMNTYAVNINTSAIELVDDTVDLERAFTE